MKILQVNNKVPYPTKDGGAIACMNMVKGFSQLGHDVTVLSMNTLKHHVSYAELPEEVKKTADFRLVDVPAKISPLQAFFNLVFSKQPYNAVRFINADFAETLERLLDEKKFDVIQLEGLYVCPYIPVIRKKTKALIVYRAHNIEYEIWERTAKISKGMRRFYLENLSKRIKRFEKFWLNAYDVLVPISTRDAGVLKALGNVRPSHVSQTGIDSSVLPGCSASGISLVVSYGIDGVGAKSGSTALVCRMLLATYSRKISRTSVFCGWKERSRLAETKTCATQCGVYWRSGRCLFFYEFKSHYGGTVILR